MLPLESLHGSLLESQLDSLLEIVIETAAFERATLQVNWSIACEGLANWTLWVCGSFGQQKELSPWKLWCWHWHNQPTYLSASSSMITFTNTIAITTIAIITIAIITTIIVTISPRLTTHTYAHNGWDASRTFCWKIWAGDPLSPWFNYLPSLRNL